MTEALCIKTQPDNKIIAKAGNSVTGDIDPTAHAEINAIRAAAKKLKTFEVTYSVIVEAQNKTEAREEGFRLLTEDCTGDDLEVKEVIKSE